MQKPTASNLDAAPHHEEITFSEAASLPGELPVDPENAERVQQKWQVIRCYGFESAGISFIAPINVYCEVLTQAAIETLPNSPTHFAGLCNVRGNLVPVYQLEPLVEQKPIAPNYAFVIGKLDQAAALLVKDKPKPFDLREFEEVECQETLPAFLQSAISKCYRRDNQYRYLVDQHQFFSGLATLGTSSSPYMTS